MAEAGIIAVAIAQAWIYISMAFLRILLSSPNKGSRFFPTILRKIMIKLVKQKGQYR